MIITNIKKNIHKQFLQSDDRVANCNNIRGSDTLLPFLLHADRGMARQAINMPIRLPYIMYMKHLLIKQNTHACINLRIS